MDLNTPYPGTGRNRTMMMLVTCPRCDGMALDWQGAQPVDVLGVVAARAVLAEVTCRGCGLPFRFALAAIDGTTAVVCGYTADGQAHDAGLGDPEPCRACGGLLTGGRLASLVLTGGDWPDVTTNLLITPCATCPEVTAATIVPHGGLVWVLYGPAPGPGEQPGWVQGLLQPDVLAACLAGSRPPVVGTD